MRASNVWVPLATALAVALATALLTVPGPLVFPLLTPDAVEYLGIAHSWIHGAGFVDPVQWNFYLSQGVPLPGFAMRAPALPLLLALPLAAGATVPQVIALHALWASLVAGAIALVACRFMRPPAAAAAALLLALSPSWILAARHPLTEATGVAAFLLVVTTAPGALRSVRGALLCSAATLLAWLARPNLGAFALVVLAGAVWHAGARRAIRSRALWAYALGFALLLAAVHGAMAAGTGLAPYAGYGALTEFLHGGALHYSKAYVGAWNFLRLHHRGVLNAMQMRVGDVLETLCLTPWFHFAGWLLPPAVVYGLLRSRDHVLEHRILAFAALGFSLLIILHYGPFDAWRFPLFSAVAASLGGFALLDDLVKRWQRRLHARASPRAAHLAGLVLPVAVLLLFVLTSARAALPASARAWQIYAERGAARSVAAGVDARLRRVCAHLDRNAAVAAAHPHPWGIYFWCGNAAMALPVDLESHAWQQRFLAERRPGYIVATPDPAFGWLQDSERLRVVASDDRFTVYALRNPAPESRPWKAPAPLACAGQEPDCARLVGR
jgi:hypothetical protein